MIDSFRGENYFLSNFYVRAFTVETSQGSITAPTSEHFFQAAKTWDLKERSLIYGSKTPREAKKIGSLVDLRSDWEKVKRTCMLHILRAKFSDPYMTCLLLDTGTQELVEGNVWHDKVWGVCHCDKCLGTGDNLLGEVLMQIRKDLRTAR